MGFGLGTPCCGPCSACLGGKPPANGWLFTIAGLINTPMGGNWAAFNGDWVCDEVYPRDPNDRWMACTWEVDNIGVGPLWGSPVHVWLELLPACDELTFDGERSTDRFFLQAGIFEEDDTAGGVGWRLQLPDPQNCAAMANLDIPWWAAGTISGLVATLKVTAIN